MTDWSECRLGDLAEVLDSRRVPVRAEDRPRGSVPYYGANGQQGWIDRSLFDEPLVLLAEDGGHFEEFVDRPIAYRIDGPSWVNNHAHVLRAAAGVDQGYLFWSLRNKDIRHWIAGGTRSKLTRREMEQIVITLPPPKEQRRIAEILDMIDETIQTTERVITKSRRLEVAILMESIDFSHSEARLGDVCSLLQDGTHLPPPRTSEGPVLLSVQNLADGQLRPSARDTHIPEAFWRDTRRALPIEPGDVCLAVVGTLGKLGVVPPDLPPFTVQRSLTVLRGDPMRMHNDYLFAVMRHGEFQRNLWQRANQTAQPGVYLGELRTIGVPSPPLEEQQRVVSILDTINETIQTNEKQLGKFRELRSGLAADLLSGRVRTVAA